ncbi:MAG: hypothetical protein ABIC04_01405 [Nanoarchaeota archaeon]
MVRKAKEIEEIKVKYSDVLHLKNLYVMLHEYLYEEGWMGMPKAQGGPTGYASVSHANIEKLYLEKFCQKGLHKGGKEMWLWWRFVKAPESKFNQYFRYRLDVDFHMVYMTDLEIMHQGKKMKVQKGEIEIIMRAYIESDYNGEWAKHWFLKHFMDLYESRILSTELEKKEKELWREVYRFQGVIKRYLNLRNFVPTPEPFHPAIYGYEGEPVAGGPLQHK